jgi:hypothetical protein
MRIDFFKNLFHPDSATKAFAQTGSKIIGLDRQQDLREIDPSLLKTSQLICSIDLPDIPTEELNAILVAALRGGLLDNPAFYGKGESLLFAIVNEALHQLEEAQAWLERP